MRLCVDFLSQPDGMNLIFLNWRHNIIYNFITRQLWRRKDCSAAPLAHLLSGKPSRASTVETMSTSSVSLTVIITWLPSCSRRSYANSKSLWWLLICLMILSLSKVRLTLFLYISKSDFIQFFFVYIKGLSKEDRALMVKVVILERLPEDNYAVLKYLVQFLAKVYNPFRSSLFILPLRLIIYFCRSKTEAI